MDTSTQLGVAIGIGIVGTICFVVAIVRIVNSQIHKEYSDRWDQLNSFVDGALPPYDKVRRKL